MPVLHRFHSIVFLVVWARRWICLILKHFQSISVEDGSYLVAHYTRLSSTLFADKEGTLASVLMFKQGWYRTRPQQQEGYRTRVTIKAVDSEGKYVICVLEEEKFGHICLKDKYWKYTAWNR